MALDLDHGPSAGASDLSPTPGDAGVDALSTLYRAVRSQTQALCGPLEPEDFGLQSMPDASPAKWHLAHTTWFFETFILARAIPDYRPFNDQYSFLFNSYYNAVGERIHRSRRGLISRPSIAEVGRYREHVDAAMLQVLGDPGRIADDLASTVKIGLHHEQQHQELLLTDLKHGFSANPIRPAYVDRPIDVLAEAPPLRWVDHPEGVRRIGHDGVGFAFDNETPRHRQFVEGFRIASRPSTNGEFLAFLEDGGYARPEFWLSDGWDARRTQAWDSPLYWERRDGRWWMFTLAGMRLVVASEPVCHISYYEADAFARWSGARLPTEAEWEVAASDLPVAGNFLDSGRFHPATPADPAPSGFFGDVWEWTSSPYTAYPGYRPAAGALGEYNGKFMCNQFVLRGGSCASPRSHLRASYRNFFGPPARWQFSGVRLAQDRT